ncbi:MAG: hypothetical protein ACRDOV_00475 [Streptomyces sp.]
MTSQTTTNSDVRGYEYSTFVPLGSTCTGCQKPITQLERCRRVALERQSGPPVVTYQHIDCEDPQGLKRAARR